MTSQRLFDRGEKFTRPQDLLYSSNDVQFVTPLANLGRNVKS
jgi:hypothetical protein